ncbi:hypothetical protein PENSUB_8405 [Penicillium subrubescens]|uniref:Uncharacterized protein n=1 Tax=Penicillium subrubescens TaxID=1316194 RepID=A0A1Q5TH69_9EURO|nr:hypothetical protein PENSUB_8405 [Penicillium subrubescens]
MADVKRAADAQRILNSVMPGYVAWSAGVGGKRRPYKHDRHGPRSLHNVLKANEQTTEADTRQYQCLRLFPCLPISFVLGVETWAKVLGPSVGPDNA